MTRDQLDAVVVAPVDPVAAIDRVQRIEYEMTEPAPSQRLLRDDVRGTTRNDNRADRPKRCRDEASPPRARMRPPESVSRPSRCSPQRRLNHISHVFAPEPVTLLLRRLRLKPSPVPPVLRGPSTARANEPRLATAHGQTVPSIVGANGMSSSPEPPPTVTNPKYARIAFLMSSRSMFSKHHDR